MELRIIHLYPDLMSLYGSYANVLVLRRHLERLGHTVTVETAAPGQAAALAGADFIYLGAGTERRQKAALESLRPLGPELKAAAADGVSMLFAGTAMDLLGRAITDAEGAVYEGLGLAAFTTVQEKRRYVGDVFGPSPLCRGDVVGYMNKSSLISGVETPLLTACTLGFGNDAQGGPEGYHGANVLASHLTGPLLVKNPELLAAVVSAVCARRGLALPEKLPADEYAAAGYAVTLRELQARRDRG